MSFTFLTDNNGHETHKAESALLRTGCLLRMKDDSQILSLLVAHEQQMMS